MKRLVQSFSDRNGENMAFNPWQWARNLWPRATLADRPTEAGDEGGHEKRPTAQPFFLCPSCGYMREETPAGRKFCSQCVTEFSPEDLALLTKARTWLNDCTRKLPLKDLITLAREKNEIRKLMQPFFRDLPKPDKAQLKLELESAGFPGINTLEMLVHWANTRLNDRVRRGILTARNGPPIRFVRGGLPGLGK